MAGENVIAQPKMTEVVTLERLTDQIEWYCEKSRRNQKMFKLLKLVTIISASVIPVLTTINEGYCTRVAAGLGVLIAILEAVQQLNLYQGNWSNYRATSEVLKHEKYLYLAQAGIYKIAEGRATLLAERLETLIAQEESKWMNLYAEGPQTHSRAAADRP